ncbi:uncharacterized protein ACRADG_010933 [Cochliomyia hominivorax]
MKEFKSLNFIIYLVFISFSLYNPCTEVCAFSIKLTNVGCLEYDKSFVEFKKCYLKVLDRNKIGVNIYVKLLKTPVENIVVNAALYVKSASLKYNPFFFNTTFNFCKFFENPNRLVFWKVALTIITQYSNVNHSCPYDHDLIVKNLIINSEKINNMPSMAGDYLIKIKAAVKNHYKGEVLLYFNIKE